jgi:hypothetical protein
MAILIDFSQVVIARLQADENIDKLGPNDIGLIKHMILTSILAQKKKFGKQYGDIVLCFDGKNYWRKDYFPYYKAKRKQGREESGIDWNTIYNAMDEMHDELIANFPYKVIKVEGAEGDDVIGCLVKWFQTNELTQQGLMNDPQPIMIVSADGDHIQLQKYGNVKQWSTKMKKFLVPDMPINDFIVEHICKGDTGDGVPNILSADNCIADGIRQKSFMKKRLPDFFKHGIDACQNDEERRNYIRNQKLVDYDCIPQKINDIIVQCYISQTPVKSKTRIMNYFMKNRMKLLLDSANEF